MKISHELPLCFLDKSYEWNDYDYLLPTFFQTHKEYKEYFQQARKDNRFIIMDNGLFENGKLTNKELIEIVNEIKPNIFITPDVWNNAEQTYKNAKYWKNVLEKQLPKEIKLMVVLQGNTLMELEELYTKCEDLGYKHFSFNHSSNYYNLINYSNNDELNRMLGRIRLIHLFKENGLIKYNHYIHLLGCSLPQEFFYYKDIKINSIDTTNPVICGALDIEYKMGGLLEKPKQKLEEFFEKDLLVKINFIISNIQNFKKFCNGT